ncbi:MAG TPA: protoporphyrinogen oxidase [Anaerolineaceae bacterium]|nr:protoporphyrinogen oxidase [Anaerolineaceae bacterium]
MVASTQPGREVAIVGGGITGLAAAHALQKKAREDGVPLTFTVYESEPRLGGKILSEARDGFLIEGGPDSFFQQKPWAAELAVELGLETALTGANPRQKKLFVVNRGRLTPMPDGVLLIIPTRFLPFVVSPLISWPGKVRMGMDFVIPRRKDGADESIGDFIRRRLGKEALEKIAEPLLSGIHVSDPEQQSLLATFPRFRALEERHGSLIRGMLAQRQASRANGKASLGGVTRAAWKNSVFVTLRGGMGTLVDALANALRDERGGRVLTNCAVSRIKPEAGGGFRVVAADGTGRPADAVILAGPAFVSSSLVEGFAPGVAQALDRIRYVSTATVSLAYPTAKIGNPFDGIGFIIPRGEKRRISACTASSTKFPDRAPARHILLRCFVGGPGYEEMVDLEDSEIVRIAREELADLLGIRAEPALARVYRWPKGNPQYDVGHLERVKELHALCAEWPGLFLAGAAYEGVGVPDCIHQGNQAAEKALAYLARPEQIRVGGGQP